MLPLDYILVWEKRVPLEANLGLRSLRRSQTLRLQTFFAAMWLTANVKGERTVLG